MKDFVKRHSEFFTFVGFVFLFSICFLLAVLVPMSLTLSKTTSVAYATFVYDDDYFHQFGNSKVNLTTTNATNISYTSSWTSVPSMSGWYIKSNTSGMTVNTYAPSTAKCGRIEISGDGRVEFYYGGYSFNASELYTVQVIFAESDLSTNSGTHKLYTRSDWFTTVGQSYGTAYTSNFTFQFRTYRINGLTYFGFDLVASDDYVNCYFEVFKVEEGTLVSLERSYEDNAESGGDTQVAYNEGYTDGFSAGQTAGYNSGYTAGVNSVDTQSYYNQGYSAGQTAGYNAGYQAGVNSINQNELYQTGYNAGYQAGVDSVFTNGLVNDNIIYNNTFVNTGQAVSYSGLNNGFIRDWNNVYGTTTWVNNYLYHVNNNTWQGISYTMSDFTAGEYYTFAVNGYSTTGRFGIYVFDFTNNPRVEIANKQSTASTDTVLYLTFQIPVGCTDCRIYIYGQDANSDFYVSWAKLESGQSFTGFVNNDYTNFGYYQGIGDMISYVNDNSVSTKLSLGQTVATGGFNVPINSSITVNVEQSFKIENASYRDNVSSPYDPLTQGLVYNVVWGSGASSNNAGYYGAVVNIATISGYYDYVPANTTFYFNVKDFVSVKYDNGLWYNSGYGLFIVFYDINNNLIIYNPNDFNGTNFISSPCSYSSSTPLKTGSNDYIFYSGVYFCDEYTMNNIGLDNGYAVCSRVYNESDYGTMYFNLPYDIKCVGFITYLDTNGRYFGYNLNMNYLPSNDYTDGYQNGYYAGKKLGESIGRNEGWKNAKEFYTDENGELNDYSFKGFFVALFDTPVQILRNTLDFEIFDYNLASFLFSILTVAVVLLIVKKFI